MKLINDLKKTLFMIFATKLNNPEPLAGLEGKVVVITGASQGLGKATAEYLYAQKCKIAAISKNIRELELAFPKKQYPDILIYEMDITDYNKCAVTMENIYQKLGKIDILINNAGINLHKPFEEINKTEIDQIVDTNIKGTIYSSRAAVPFMRKNKHSTIINIGSKISHNTYAGPNKVLYITTKHAIEGFSYALNRELNEYGIRVVCLMPGTINTFVALKSGNHMPPTRVSQVIAEIIKFEDIDFEGIIFKSTAQNI